MRATPESEINRVIQTVDRIKARLVFAKGELEQGETISQEKMQYVMDSDMAELKRRYRRLVNFLPELERRG